jgi:hypothetical protein
MWSISFAASLPICSGRFKSAIIKFEYNIGSQAFIVYHLVRLHPLPSIYSKQSKASQEFDRNWCSQQLVLKLNISKNKYEKIF